jgi:hypothetical protein
MGKTWHVECNGFHLHRGRPRRWLPKGRSEFYVGLGRFVFTLRGLFGKGICIVARRYRGNVPRDAVAVIQWEVPSMKKRFSKTSPEGAAQHLAAVETTAFAHLLPLVEHCSYRKYDDGDPREPGWITIKTQGAAWCVQVKDPDAACSFTAVGDTLDKALETAALLLACDEAPWEADVFLAAAKAKKMKK